MTFLDKIKPSTCKIYIQNKTHKYKIYKKLILLVSVGVIIYFSFYCPSTKLTHEGLINFLSQRKPPSWLVPILPSETVDIELTKNYKRIKLNDLKKKTNVIQLDVKNALGKGKNSSEENKDEQSSFHILRDDLSDAVNTLVEFWAITVVMDQNQDQNQPQKIIVGEGSQPINLNDRVLRWQKEIEVAAAKYHLNPEILAAVIEQESGGEPEAISPVGAIGLMQLMPSTAELMGVNPYDPAQNIDGGAHYLQLQVESFGNVQAALAAYNAGPGEVESGNWSKIPETLNYVQKVPVLIHKYERIWQENREKSKESKDVLSTP